MTGPWRSSTRRSVPPICGEHMQDLAGTAQGNWFRPTPPGGEPSTADREDDDFAFAHDYVDPSVPVISLGNRGPVVAGPLPGTTAHWITYPVAFTPGGQINPDPAALDGSGWLEGLMDLPDATTIRVFYFDPPIPVACAALLLALPPDFELSGPGVFDYER